MPTGPQLLSLLVPRGGVTVERDLAYGPDSRHKVDLYRPRRPNGRLLAFFYGGGWDNGGKAGYRFAVQPFLQAGYTVAIPDYRLYPQVRFPAFVEDGALALRWLLDRTRAAPIYLAGHSAGAFNAAMLALDRHYLHTVGVAAESIAAVVGLAGPYDFSTRSKDLAPIFAGAPDSATQPVKLVTRGTPPMFLATGERDKTVHPRNSRHLAERLRASGVEVELKVYPGVAHIGIVTAMTWLLRHRAPVARDALEFLARH